MRKILYSTVIFALLILPQLDARFHFIPHNEIAGMENSSPRPQFSKADFKKQKFQPAAESWLQRNNGLWGWFVKIENQLLVSLFGQVSTNYGTSVQVGNEGYFFQPMYYRSYNRTRPPPVSLIESKIANAKKLADLLKARGIPVVMLMSPNLVALYPDLMPKRYIDDTRLARKTSYETAKAILAKDGPPTVDAFELLQGKLASAPYRFFEPTGSHWNEAGACLAAEQVTAKFNEVAVQPFPVPNCTNISIEFPPPEADQDLVKIANVLHPEWYSRPAPVVHPVALTEPQPDRHVLLVGTSFLFGLEQQLLRHKVANSTELLFYYRERRTNGDATTSHVLDKKKMDWQKLLSADAIVLEVNQSGPGQVGFGFIEDALRYLSPNKKHK